MKQLIRWGLFSLFFCWSISLAAQSLSNNKGTIAGKVFSGKSGHPLASVTVMLYKMPDTVLVNGAMTSANGSFVLNNLSFDNYELKISYLGYTTQIITNLNPRSDKPQINAGDINLSENTHMLNTVNIVAHVEKPLIQDNGDMLTYNVGSSLTNEGDVALDVLGKVPMVSVDAQGNVQLNGQSPLILINGKPSELGANAIMDILQSLPADAIEKIEVMENPPPKYQSEGSGGVINIILKKGRNLGITGRASVSAGTLNNYRGNVYASYRNRHTAISGIISSSYRDVPSNGYTNRETFDPGDTLFTNQEFTADNKTLSPFARINIDHDLSPKDNITLTAAMDGFNNLSNSFTTSSNLNDLKQVTSILDQQVNTHTNNIDFGGSVKYTHQFDSTGQDISADISFSPNSSFAPETFTQSFLDENKDPTQPDSTVSINNNNFNHHTGVDIDYEKPIKGTRSTFSAGYRGDFNTEKKDYLAENYDASSGTYIKNDTASNNIQYQENVQGAYVDFQSYIHSFRYHFGVRVEHTTTSFNLYDGGSNDKNSYTNLFPFISLNQQLKNHAQLHLSYHMRIDRPGLSELNPFIYYNDPYNISYGNPQLKASLTNFFLIGYSRFVPDNKFGIDAHLIYDRQNNISKQVTLVNNEGVAASTYENIASGNRFGGHIYLSFHPIEPLNISFFMYSSVTTYQLKDTFNILLNNSSAIGSNLNVSYDFTNSLSAEISMNYHKMNTGQGIGYENFSHSIAVRYLFPGDKLSLNVKAIDPFRQSTNTNESKGTDFLIYTHTNNDSRYFALTLSYRFDRIGRNSLDKQKSLNNDNDHHHWGGDYHHDGH
jgi:Outer membrane protein beta-barrel family/CarboxypepD_reg-like domain